MLAEGDIIFRFVASAVIGLVIGFARRHKAAGIRTFTLICLGATIFTIVSIGFDGPGADPSRIIAQIVAGIGFLGLGVIWKSSDRLTGVTTAATVWVSAAIGVMIGLGMIHETIVGTVLTFVIVYSKPLLTRLGLEREENGS
jgi:putative Mg2+ transporter-C (MgtC) family protein